MATVPHSKLSIGSASTAGPFDYKKDGYGSAEPKYHNHRPMGSGFPYDMTDEEEEHYEEIESTDTGIDEEGEKAIHKKADGPHDFDNAGFGHDDPFHFVDGATRLTEMLESIGVGTGITPVPGLNKRRSSGGTGGTKAGTAHSDGSSHMPQFKPRSDIWAGPSNWGHLHNEDSLDNYSDVGVNDDVFDPNDHELYLTESNLRKWIRGIIIKTQYRN